MVFVSSSLSTPRHIAMSNHPSNPVRVLVLHAPADRHHLRAFQAAFTAQPHAAACRLIPLGIPAGVMCRNAITQHVLAQADAVVYLLSPRYVAANPDWAEQLRRARDDRSTPLDTYVVVAEPVDLSGTDVLSLARRLPSNVTARRGAARLHLRKLATELLDRLLSPVPVRQVVCMFANAIHNRSLELDREWRDIREVNQRAGSPLALTACWAARVRDLHDTMLDGPIDVLHFSGHGEPGGLCFATNDGGQQWVEIDRLVGVLAQYEPRCLVFNACHSADALESVRGRVPYLIAMQGPTPDCASIEFSRAFYDALAHRWTIPHAFEHARRSTSLHDGECSPQLLT
jgi:hypothetical protein